MNLQCYETITALDCDLEYQQMKIALRLQNVFEPLVEVITEFVDTLMEAFKPIVIEITQAVKSFWNAIKNYSKINKVIALTKHKKKRVRKKNLARLERLLVK